MLFILFLMFVLVGVSVLARRCKVDFRISIIPAFAAMALAVAGSALVISTNKSQKEAHRNLEAAITYFEHDQMDLAERKCADTNPEYLMSSEMKFEFYLLKTKVYTKRGEQETDQDIRDHCFVTALNAIKGAVAISPWNTEAKVLKIKLEKMVPGEEKPVLQNMGA